MRRFLTILFILISTVSFAQIGIVNYDTIQSKTIQADSALWIKYLENGGIDTLLTHIKGKVGYVLPFQIPLTAFDSIGFRLDSSQIIGIGSTNELQSLILTGNTLGLTQSSETVDLNQETVTQTNHNLSVGDWIKVNSGIYEKAIASSPINADVIGVVSEVINLNQFKYQYAGTYTVGTWIKGQNYFLSPDILGTAETSPSYTHGDVQVFLGTGIDTGLLLEIDVGEVIDTTGVIVVYKDIFNEVPAGLMNEVNVNFTLSNTPIIGTTRIYLNGLRQAPTDDYSVSGAVITFTEAPFAGDKILVDYKY